MKRMSIFAVTTLALIALAGWLLTLGFPTTDDRRAIEISGVVAFVVQILSFAIARAWAATNVIAGWGLGMLIRFVVLAMYALFGASLLGATPTAALVSLVAFFFVSTLLEPVLLSS
jgi:hypothetical protein